MRSANPATNVTDSLSIAILVRNEVLCRGLEAVLQSLPTVGTVHRCVEGDDIPALLHTEKFDFLIATAPDAGWLETADLPADDCRTKILLLVDESATTDLSGYAAVPVDGFLSQQDLGAETLADTLHRSGLGELPMPPVLARALLAQADSPPYRQRNRSVSLTSREFEALSLLVRGLSNKQIARRLAISSHGAKRLVASIMLKLDAPNRTAAVVNAIKAGIVDYQ
jgi:two-component system, NarL family, nitrate/nitrite response regulator NarL